MTFWRKINQATLGWIFAGVLLGRLAWKSAVDPRFEGDTGALVEYAHGINRCIDQGVYSGCKDGGHYPLLQHLFAVPMNRYGLSDDVIYRVLSSVSLLAWFALLAILYLGLRRRGPLVQKLGLGILLTSPLIAYQGSSFGEMNAAFLALAFTACRILGAAPLLQIALGLFAGITKDIAPPFLVLIALYPGFASKKPWRDSLREALPSGVGAILALISNTAFNYFRNGVPYNQHNLVDYYLVHSLTDRISFFFGLWVAPNGGVAFFWLSFFVLLYSCTWLLLSKAVSRGNWIPLTVVFLLLVTLTFGLSKWWAPFGWIAWGPRLMLPWLPAASFILLDSYGEDLVALLRNILSTHRKAALLVLAAISISGIAQCLAYFNLDHFNDVVVATDERCPHMPFIEQGVEYYYQCMQYRLWAPRSFVLWEVLKTSVLQWRLLIPFTFISLTWISFNELSKTKNVS